MPGLCNRATLTASKRSMPCGLGLPTRSVISTMNMNQNHNLTTLIGWVKSLSVQAILAPFFIAQLLKQVFQLCLPLRFYPYSAVMHQLNLLFDDLLTILSLFHCFVIQVLVLWVHSLLIQ